MFQQHQKHCLPQAQWHWKNYFKDILATTCSLFWKLWSFENLEKANFTHFKSFLLGENLLIHLLWQKWRLWKVLNLQKFERTNFVHFVSRPLGASRPLGQELPKHIFWQRWRILKTLKLWKACQAWKIKLWLLYKLPAW